MNEIKCVMKDIEEKKKHDGMSRCAIFMETFIKQLPTKITSTHIQSDGGIYLPIKEGCAKQAMESLAHTYGIQHSSITSPKNVCIRISLTDDLSCLHAVPFSYSCDYVKRIFNQ